jgi:dTDP-4-dehydrorhamnose reductase
VVAPLCRGGKNLGEPKALEAKVLVFGASGQVGRELTSKLREITLGFDHAAVDICDGAAVDRRLRDNPAATVVNAAAYTAVDRAESEQSEAFRVNRDGAAILARAAASAGVPLIQISTDYVFDGTKRTPYRESDPIAPLNTYGLSKGEGEHAVRTVPLSGASFKSSMTKRVAPPLPRILPTRSWL